MYIPNLCHPLHWSSRPHLRGEAGPGDHWPIPRVSLLSVENFPTGNHIAENTVCGCNTRNSWLLQHDDIHSTFLAHKFVIINSQLCIQYSSQDVYKRGYMDVWSVCMQACKTRGIWGHAPPGNVRCSEIASEAIVGQKQYVLHPIWLSMYTFAC